MDERVLAATPAELTDSLKTVVAALLHALAESRSPEDAARAARELARWLEVEAGRLAAEPAPAPERAPESAPPPAPPAQEPLVERVLRLGGKEVVVATAPCGSGAAAPPPPPPRRPPAPAPLDPARFAEPEPAFVRPDFERTLPEAIRCARLKVRACELALRGGRSSEDEEARRQVRELRDEARARERCYLWPLDPNVPLPEPALLELCARTYENLASGLEVLMLVPRWVSVEEQADVDLLQLLAEAQSALYWALEAADIWRDEDQLAAFIWLKEQTSTHRVFLPRYMSLDTGADPTQWLDTGQRIEAVGKRLRDAESDRRERKRVLDKLRYHVGRLRRSEGEELRRDEWRKVLRALDEWVAGGRQPSSRDVCDPLLEVVDELPDDIELPAGAQRVMLALDEQIAARERAKEEAPAAPQRPGPEVLAARELLQGKVVLLIGGHRRAFEAERLERDLGLAELRWITTRSHRSLAPLIEEIRKPEVDLVVIAPRWSDHAFAELKPEAQRAGKPFLVLPGGYGTNRVAYEVMNQVSEQLRA